MVLHFTDGRTGAQFHLALEAEAFGSLYFKRSEADKFYTIVWNKGPEQTITVDEVTYRFPAQSMLPLMINQVFSFERPEQIIAWQFNRDFYCVVDHDKEVSCVGFLFYGSAGLMFADLDEHELSKIEKLLWVFIEEFQTADNIQQDMLQMLLKRLIIILTRLTKKQYIHASGLSDARLDIIRQYNLLVETHFRRHHQVQFYAALLHRSPKTLSNLFALYNHKSPLQVIQERVILEAKRLLMYTGRSAKEISYDLGFEDAAYFSNFFKKHTSQTPGDFRNSFPAGGQQV